MRIDELMMPKTIPSAGKILKKAGYAAKGDGTYAKVYQGPNSNYVLKLFKNKDLGYITYINAIKDKSNKYFPRVFGKIINVNDKYSAIRLEPLQKLNYKTDFEFYSAVHDYIIGITRQHSYISTDDFKRAQDFVNNDPELKDACELISNIIKSNNKFYPDAHEENIMLRGSQYVIIDPISTL